MIIKFSLNGKNTSLDTDPMKRLLDILRENYNLLSVKESCGEGECGACTVLLNGLPVTSCLINIIQVDGGSVITAEGISETSLGKLIAASFTETNAVQCGFCFPGFLVTTYHYLQHDPDCDENKIKNALSGNICRCTGYQKIIEAVQLACRKLADQEHKHEDV
ncbi:MAG: (2Fe-2S)-binding protein [Candidatus Cloacimonetes bacterium]|nr:(2Fe-2S)-binding protein [Candidatus Cloacimonadota bacterium]